MILARTRRVAFLGAFACLAVAASALQTASCGSSPAGTGGAGPASTTASTSTGSGGAHRSTSKTTGTTSGAGASGGGTADPFDAGSAIVWAHYPLQIAGCDVSRAQNPKGARVFAWTPCAGQPGCERAVFLGEFAGWHHPTDHQSVVHTTAQGTVAALNIGGPDYVYVLFTDADGWLLDGYSGPATQGGEGCMPVGGQVAAEHYGFLMLHDGNFGMFKGRIGGLVASFGSDAVTTFEPGYYGSDGGTNWPPGLMNDHVLASKRWFFNWGYNTLLSMSAPEGADMQVFAQFDDTMIRQGDLTLTPTGLLFARMEILDNGAAVREIIMASDGVSDPTPYLVAPDGTDYGAVGYADTHVAWMRGVNATNINEYETVELWASLYSADPAALKPYKVADLGLPGMSTTHWYAAGRGLYTTPTAGDAPGEIGIYDLAKKTYTTHNVPDGYTTSNYLGITPTHVWMYGTPPQQDPNYWEQLLVRFAVP